MSSNSSFYRITALTLALMMFTTSVGLAVDMHYCGGQLKTTSFFGKAKACHDMGDAETSSRLTCPLHQILQNEHKGYVIDKPDCCQNKSLHIQLDQDQNIQVEGLTISKPLQQLISAIVVTFFTDLRSDQPKPVYAHYRPPLIPRDIPVLVQSFLL